MFNGSLTLEHVAAGRLKALQNAEDLVQDAKCLYGEQRWPRSYFLSQIAVEEAGKYFYLFSSCVAIVAGDIIWSRFWKALRSHRDKTTFFLLMEDIFIPSADAPKQLPEMRDDARQLDRAKMWSLYCDYEQNEFFTPSEVIGHALTTQALNLASNRVRLAREFEDSHDWSRALGQMKREEVEAYFATLRQQLNEDKSASDADGKKA